MWNLLRFLIRYHIVFLFVALEVLALTLFFSYNVFQRASFLNITDTITGYYHTNLGNLRVYFQLDEINRQLAEENARLRNLLDMADETEAGVFQTVTDSIRGQSYSYIPARVVNNSVNKQRNFITLDRGSKDGIRADDGVITSVGIVGVVYRVSPHFSTVISLLNIDLRLSAKLKKNDYFGSLFWDGLDYRKAILTEIPHHVEVNRGDTIITSGYSTIFPEGITVGIVDNVSRRGGDFLEISVLLSTGFKNLSHVEVVTNLLRTEKEQIENPLSGD
jgi:rod shape-determining protein MreC